MKKILSIIFLSLFLITPCAYSYAQEESIPTEQEVNIEEEDTIEEKEKSLADELELEEEDNIQPQKKSFGTILVAILIPCLLIILFYYIFKVFKF